MEISGQWKLRGRLGGYQNNSEKQTRVEMSFQLESDTDNVLYNVVEDQVKYCNFR